MGKIVFNNIIGNKNEVFAMSPYFYHLFLPKKNETIMLDYLSSLTLYALKSSFIVNNTIINEGNVVQIENIEATIYITQHNTEILLAGTTKSYTKKKSIIFSESENIYKVLKPWGNELWINDEHPKYVLKRVVINAGYRTSLQYHKFKRETNVIFSGTAIFHYTENTIPENIKTKIVKPLTSVNIYPNTLHRVEAVTDVILYEVSTPYLDDVFRLQDDTNRINGRILSEHGGT